MSLKDAAESAAASAHLKVESLTPATSYATNGFVFAWGAMTFNEIMMLIGTALALATFFVNLYFQRRRDRRDQELHVKRMHSPDPEPNSKTEDKS